MQHEELIEAAMLDPPALTFDVAVLDVDLRGLAEARRCLWVDCVAMIPGRSGPRVAQAHGEAAGIDWVELHEACHASSNRM